MSWRDRDSSKLIDNLKSNDKGKLSYKDKGNYKLKGRDMS